MKVDVILAPATPQVEAASRVTKKIPIVFANHANPVAAADFFRAGAIWSAIQRTSVSGG